MGDARTRTSAEACERAYDEHASAVFRTAYAVLGDHDAAQDITADVFLELRHQPELPDGADGLGPFLERLARSRAVDAWRRGAAAGRTTERLERDVVALAYWGGMSAGEIAGASGVPIGTVKSGMRLGLQRLAGAAPRVRPADA